MNAAAGSAGVLLAFVASIGAIVTLGTGLVRGRASLTSLAAPYVALVLGGAVVAFAAMERALITRDFTVLYVAEHGSTRTPALYNVATLWGALEGSLLLWGLVLAGYLALVTVRFRHRLGDPLVGWALLTLFVICAFFFGLLAWPANPFIGFDAPLGYDGPGPDPLLQNHPLMAIHPPMLYLGYVGFSVPFAFAIAALATGRVGEGWLLETRRWTLFAWGFLTVGIVLGAWWSYEVLGWGGYWAWDPVENASFLPWLTGTAYLHSVMVQERRGMLRVWNLSLLCATFSLTILGTFLTRSGVISSVHAFSNGSIGAALIVFFAVVVLLSVGLIGWRGDQLRAPGTIDSPVSREGAFLANNVLFAAFAFVVLLGTVFPLVIEALQNRQISVGPQYFDRMSMPIGFALLTIMAIAPALPWRKASGEILSRRLHVPAWIGTACVVFTVVAGGRGLAFLLAIGLGGFAGGAAVRQIFLATRRQGWRGFVGRANGGMVVHLGVVLLAIGMAASSTYIDDQEFALEPGQVATIAGHTVELLGTETQELAEKQTVAARVRIDGGPVHEPAISLFRISGRPIGEPSVRPSFVDDVFVTLIRAPEDDGPTVIRVIVRPLVTWIWTGGLLMGVGTFLAALPHRRRVRSEPGSRGDDSTPASDDLGSVRDGSTAAAVGAADGPSAVPAGTGLR